MGEVWQRRRHPARPQRRAQVPAGRVRLRPLPARPLRTGSQAARRALAPERRRPLRPRGGAAGRSRRCRSASSRWSSSPARISPCGCGAAPSRSRKRSRSRARSPRRSRKRTRRASSTATSSRRNVKVTPDGKVKVLDFGLAKAWSGDAASGSAPDLSQSPTLAHTGTAAGLILGTAAYMSPEQARGRAVDKRADVWAFGVVLFEMLTGRRLFIGETVSDTLAAVLRQEIDWSALPAGTPPAVRALLRRCLEREPKKRLRDIGEARIALESPLGSSAIASAVAADGTRTRGAWLAWSVAAAALAAAAYLGQRSRGAAQADPPLVQLDVQLAEELQVPVYLGARIALSPDGRRALLRGGRGHRVSALPAPARPGARDPDPQHRAGAPAVLLTRRKRDRLLHRERDPARVGRRRRIERGRERGRRRARRELGRGRDDRVRGLAAGCALPRAGERRHAGAPHQARCREGRALPPLALLRARHAQAALQRRGRRPQLRRVGDRALRRGQRSAHAARRDGRDAALRRGPAAVRSRRQALRGAARPRAEPPRERAGGGRRGRRLRPAQRDLPVRGRARRAAGLRPGRERQARGASRLERSRGAHHAVPGPAGLLPVAAPVARRAQRRAAGRPARPRGRVRRERGRRPSAAHDVRQPVRPVPRLEPRRTAHRLRVGGRQQLRALRQERRRLRRGTARSTRRRRDTWRSRRRGPPTARRCCSRRAERPRASTCWRSTSRAAGHARSSVRP